MFPDFQYLFHFLFGLDIPAFSLIKTFGFFVALAFLGGAWVLTKELKRKEEEGFLSPEIVEEEVGKPATKKELINVGIIGFLLGYKVLGLIMNASEVANDPLSYLLSLKGNLLGGVAVAALMVYFRYSEKKKKATTKPSIQKVKIHPYQRVADIIFIAAIAGFGGAKFFNAFETWDDFIKDPIGNLLAPAGLTFYGGLITATIALYIYTKKKKISFKHLADAAAPALMLAYAIGRLGCQFSGDGDWGVYNSAYITQPDGQLTTATIEDFHQQIEKYPNYFKMFASANGQVPQIYTPAPNGLPTWLFAQNFKHNVNNDGIPIEVYSGNYNHVLPAGVYPTSMYEAVICFLLFLVLMGIRRKYNLPLQIFGIYLILNGLERFFIEKIRVNYEYDWGFIHPSQAEIISFCLIIAGIFLFVKQKKKIASA